MLLRVWAFYLWHHSCSKKFQSRRKSHFLWVGLLFTMWKLVLFQTANERGKHALKIFIGKCVCWRRLNNVLEKKFIKSGAKSRLFLSFFPHTVNDVIKKATNGWNLLDCRKMSKKNARYNSRDYFLYESTAIIRFRVYPGFKWSDLNRALKCARFSTTLDRFIYNVKMYFSFNLPFCSELTLKYFWNGSHAISL